MSKQKNLKKNIKIKRDKTIAILLDKALNYQKTGRFNLTESTLKDVLKINPNHLEALHIYSLFLMQQKEYKRSVEIIDRSLKINRTNDLIYNNKGVALKKMGKFDQAILCYKLALKINSENGESYINLGNVYQDMGENEKALSYFKKASDLNIKYRKIFEEKKLLLNSVTDEIKDALKKD